MTFQQAIKQAGIDGKIRQPHFADGWYWTILKDSPDPLSVEDAEGRAVLEIEVCHALADDWEVVESKPKVVYRKATMEDCQVCPYPPDNCLTKPNPCNIDAIGAALMKGCGVHSIKLHTSDIEPPVIEVGDVVKSVCGNSDYCTIIGVCDGGMYSLQSTTCSWCACANHVPDELPDVSDLTLIRKGPKVHEYGRVEIRDDRFMSIQTNHPMPPNGNYRLTATEDKP